MIGFWHDYNLLCVSLSVHCWKILLEKASTEREFSSWNLESLAVLTSAKLWLNFEVQFLYADRCTTWVNFRLVFYRCSVRIQSESPQYSLVPISAFAVGNLRLSVKKLQRPAHHTFLTHDAPAAQRSILTWRTCRSRDSVYMLFLAAKISNAVRSAISTTAGLLLS